MPPPPPPPRIPSLLVLLSFLCLASLRWRSAALDDVGRRTTDGGKRRRRRRRRRRRLGGLAGTSRGEEEWAAPCATRSCARLGLSVVSCLLHTHIYYHTSLHTYMLASRGRRRLLEAVLGAIGAYRSRLDGGRGSIKGMCLGCGTQASWTYHVVSLAIFRGVWGSSWDSSGRFGIHPEAFEVHRQ